MNYSTFIKLCKGVHSVTTKNIHGQESVEWFLTGEPLEVPDGYYVKIIGTATNGTIGEIVGFEPKVWLERHIKG